ncbi:universal stress protein [Blastococcus sp. PRF04-17]|uniref:universal stress protein n=1 Tax=Blastococcus sp. PRF04-17 TaxID=2933797 RepID=UPI001FF24A35|nr:universal stress protein [Blastococcus sp. PRF04-17]UOY00096.1 universal stress protein [Blastococcus sp. PRF04-17]
MLVAVDGSPESEQALRDAERFVGEPADRIVLVTVVDADGCDGEQLARVRELLRRGADRLAGSGARIDTEVVSGQPAQALLERIEADEVDLVVAGRRGRGLSRALLGSVAEQLSTRSPVPVLLAAPVAVPADRPR